MAFTLAEAVIKVFIPQGEVRGQLKQTEDAAEDSAGRIQGKLQQAFTPKNFMGGLAKGARDTRRNLLEVASGLSGVAAIASLFAKNNKDLQAGLQTTSLALAGASTAARAFGGILRLIFGHPIIAAIALIAALIFAGDDLARAWARLRAATIREWLKIRDVVVEVVSGLVDVLQGFIGFWTNILLLRLGRAEQFLDRLQRGITRLQEVAPDARDALVDLGTNGLEFLKDLFGLTGQAADEFADDLDHGLLAMLKDAGKEWEGAASEAERASGRMGRSTELSAKAAQTVLDQVQKEEEEAFAQLQEDIAEFVKGEGGRLVQIGQQFEGASSEARRFAGILGQANVENAEAADLVLAKTREQIEANIRVIDLKVRLKQATLEEAIAARQGLLDAKDLNLTEEERLRLLEEIRDIQNQINDEAAATDPMAGLRAAMRETLETAPNWKETWLNAFDGAREALSGFLHDIQTGSKDVLTAATDAVTGILDAVLQQLNQLAANWVLQQILGMATGGQTRGGGLIPLARGGFLRGLIVRAQQGLLATGPTLAAIAEKPGLNELVLPLPKGLKPEDLAKAIQGGGGTAGPVDESVTVNYNAPLIFQDRAAMQAHARSVADAVRLARRGNHPLVREGV